MKKDDTDWEEFSNEANQSLDTCEPIDYDDDDDETDEEVFLDFE